MEITQRYTTRTGRQFRIRFSYNENIQDTDKAEAFIRNLEVIDDGTKEAVPVTSNMAHFSTYEKFQSFGGYVAVNYLGVRTTAIEGLRTKVLTRVEDYLERLD